MTDQEQQAYELGVEHAKNAASWVIDGNTKHELILAVLGWGFERPDFLNHPAVDLRSDR